jgi:hypothetical protein
MKTIYTYVLSVVLLVMTGCCDTNQQNGQLVFPEGEVFLRSFMPVYYSVSGIKAYPNSGLEAHGFYISAQIGKDVYTFCSTGDNLARYNALCEKHEDMTFNRIVPDYRPNTCYYAKESFDKKDFKGFPDADFVSINVVCDVDFDEQHPSGTSLNDLIVVYIVSPYPYIKSDYTPFDWSTITHFGTAQLQSTLREIRPVYPIRKMMSELEVEDLKIIGDGYSGGSYGYLFSTAFYKGPAIRGAYYFTITMTADDGRTFSDTVRICFN